MDNQTKDEPSADAPKADVAAANTPATASTVAEQKAKDQAKNVCEFC